MRILLLATDYSGKSGGISQTVHDLLLALANHPAMDEIVVLPRRSVEPADSFHSSVRFLNARQNKKLYALSALKTALTGRRFDLVICAHLYMASLAALLSRLCRVPYWLHLYGIEAWQCPKEPLRNAVEKARFFTAISRCTRERFLSWANVPPHRVKLLPPVLHSEFSEGKKPENLLKKYNLEGKKVLLTVSRMSSEERYKGHDRVIRLLPKLLLRYAIQYVIAGEGDDRPRLESLTRELSVRNSVTFIERVSAAELPSIYRIADVFVMPSTGEGFGIVFLEAAASGLPVIGGSKDGSMDALLDGAIGRPVDP